MLQPQRPLSEGGPRISEPAMVPSRPLSEGGAIGPGTAWRGKRNPTSAHWEDVGASQSKQEHQEAGASTKVHEGQFQMFMTPREIRGKYQALEGDRQESYDERAGEMTGRSETTGGAANYPANSAVRNRFNQWHGGASQASGPLYTRNDDMTVETDDQLFSRKLEESQLSPNDYREVHQGIGASNPPSAPGWDTMANRSSAPSGMKDFNSRRPGEGTGTHEERQEEAVAYADRKMEDLQEAQDYGPSLYDRIKEQGVLSPVHLSYDQLGHMYGKNEIVGGHHRLAASEDIDPDQPIPVQHWRDIYEAKSSGTYS